MNINSSSYMIQSALSETTRNTGDNMRRLATGLQAAGAHERLSMGAIAGSKISENAGLRAGMASGTDFLQAMEVYKNGIETLKGMLNELMELNVAASSALISAQDIVTVTADAAAILADHTGVLANLEYNDVLMTGAKGLDFGGNFATTTTETIATMAVTATAAGVAAGTAEAAILTDIGVADVQLAIIGDISKQVSNMMKIASQMIVANDVDISMKLDVDFAAETSKLAKNQILNQAGTAMLAQANAQGQGLLALIQS